MEGIDAEDIKKRMSKIGIVQSYAPEDIYPYNVEFDGDIDDMPFKASELELVNKRKVVKTKVIDEPHGMTGIFRIVKVDASEFKEGQKVKVTIEEI